MLYYPINPNAGSSAEQRLIGVALIRRDADTYFSQNSYISAFRNCSIMQEVGGIGAIDANGGIPVPAGAKMAKVTISVSCGGFTNRIFSRILTNLEGGPDMFGINLRNGLANSFYNATHHMSVDGADWLRINYFFQNANYTIAQNFLTQNEAIVEFYA